MLRGINVPGDRREFPPEKWGCRSRKVTCRRCDHYPGL